MKQSTIAILTGAKGSGKTFTQKEIISLHPRIYAVETHGGEFGLPGAVEVYDAEEFEDAVRVNWSKPSFLIIFVPDYDVEAASEEVARLAYDRGNALAVFDEAADYMTASSMGGEMGKLIRQSRHRNVNVVLASPRLADLNANARTQADLWIVCGPIWTVRDLDVIEQNTSTEFRRACQEPMAHGQYRRLAFDTRTREQVEVTKEKLRELFRVPRFAPIPKASAPAVKQPQNLLERLGYRLR
jgi:hypothetical protein